MKKYDMDMFGVADEDDKDSKGGFKRFDFGLGVGLGYTFHKVYLGMNYQFGLVNIADKEQWGQSLNQEQQLQHLAGLQLLIHDRELSL